MAKIITVLLRRSSNGGPLDIPNDYTATYRNSAGDMVAVQQADVQRIRRGEYEVTLDLNPEDPVVYMIGNGDEGFSGSTTADSIVFRAGIT